VGTYGGLNPLMTSYWKTLLHNGVAVPEPYLPEGLKVKVRGREVILPPLAEEMAYHLAKKKDTQYVKDTYFVTNFMKDFAALLPDWCRGAKFEEADFTLFNEKVEREKKAKETMSKEMKKSLGAERKTSREALKAKYGYATVDGKKVEIANWLVEPPGLFMGRGAHPLRGHWKPRVAQRDVILNLDENSPVPPGEWREVVHDHNSMWMAKWADKLTEKEKYVWLHESAPIQQSRNKAKYDSATKVGTQLEKIRAKILKELTSRDRRVRQVATDCYLIDRLGLRVGDEKEEDEADTVGATTLRVEHVKLNDGGALELNFLGKDSVPWSKKLEGAPPTVAKNIHEFIARKQGGREIFDGINSKMVNRFLSGISAGLTAKVFRTYHATRVAELYLKTEDRRGKEESEKLYHAKFANLKAAEFCNHQRTVPKNWEDSLEKRKESLKEQESREKRDEKRITRLKMEISLQMQTRNYNLNTALKNYIDPRLYKSWGDYVGLDWTKIYTKSMQRKFAWVSYSKRKWETERETIEAVTPSNT
jgi:DNA topoisomerase-1